MANEDSSIAGQVVLSANETSTEIGLSRPILKAILEAVSTPREFLEVKRRRAKKFTANNIYQFVVMLDQWVSAYGPLSKLLSIEVVYIPRGDDNARN